MLIQVMSSNASHPNIDWWELERIMVKTKIFAINWTMSYPYLIFVVSRMTFAINCIKCSYHFISMIVGTPRYRLTNCPRRYQLYCWSSIQTSHHSKLLLFWLLISNRNFVAYYQKRKEMFMPFYGHFISNTQANIKNQPTRYQFQ